MISNGKLPRGIKLAYGFGFSADGIKNNSFSFFLLYFYQQIAGLDPAGCGMALSIALVIDAMADPVIGCWSDSTRSRRTPSPVPVCIEPSLRYLLFLRFHASPGYGAGSSVPLAADVGDRHALFHVAFRNSARLFGRRAAFAWMFGLINALLIYRVFLPSTAGFPIGLQNPEGYRRLAIWGAAGVTLSTFLSAALTQRAALALKPPTGSTPPFSLRAMLTAVRSAFRIPSYRNSLAGGLCLYVGFGMSENLGLYINTLFWGVEDTSVMSWYIIALLGSTVLAAQLSPWLVARYDKRKTAMGAGLAALGLRVLAVLLRLSGVLPGGGEPIVVGVLLRRIHGHYRLDVDGFGDDRRRHG